MLKSNLLWVCLVILVLGAGVIVNAQAQADQCTSLVEEAFEFIGDSCDGLGRNRVCYGFNNLQATFFDVTEAGIFSQPSDRINVESLQTITTSSLNLDENEWGIAVLNLQANIPGSMPGQNVKFLMLGDVQVEDDTMELPEDGVTIDTRTTGASRLVQEPSQLAETVLEVEADTPLVLSAISEDGSWAQATIGDVAGWIRIDALNGVDLEQLSVYDPQAFRQMQSVYFSTGIGKPTCNETPDLLVIQSPKNIKVDMRVNGADIRLGSTVMLQIIDPGLMRISTIDGLVTVNTGTPNEIVIPPGFSITAPISDPLAIGTDTTIENRIVDDDWSQPEPLTEEDLALFAVMERFPENLLNYSIEVPEPVIVVQVPPTALPPINTVPQGVAVVVAPTEVIPAEVVQPTDIPTQIPPPPDDDDDDDGGDNNPPPPPPPPPPPNPGVVNIVAGDGQTVGVGSTFPTQMQVQVVDGTGNPVAAGETVTFTVTSGLASFSGNVSVNTTTDATGNATAPALQSTGCPEGAVTVSVDSAPRTPATFNHTIIAAIVTNGNDSGAGSLREAVANACDGGTVTVAASVPTVSLSSSFISVTGKTITVMGGGTGQVIDATNSTTHFRVDSASNLTVTNLMLQNGSAFSGGSIINFGGTLTISAGTVLSNNSASGGFGGAINNQGGTVNFNGTASNNTGAYGGAIFSIMGTVNVNGMIDNNSATQGGGVYVSNMGTINLNAGTQITNNTASSFGGGFYIEGTGGTVNVSGVNFANNTATTRGGVGSASSSGTINFTNGTTIGAGNSSPNCDDNFGAGTITNDGSNTGGDATCYP